MGLQPIPPAWRQAVCTALKHGSRRANFTETGGQRWQNEFPDAFRYALDDALIRTLSDPKLHGCLVHMSFPPGETWEFYFIFRGQKLYGKLLLHPDRQRVVIFSAHRPENPKLRCE